MKLKALMILITLTPMLGFNLVAKANTCPKPKAFKEGYVLERIDDRYIVIPAYYTGASEDKTNFMLQAKPIEFSSAMFTGSITDENPTEIKGRLFSCGYYVKSNPKLALSQAKKYQKVSISLGSSSKWKKHPSIKNRYDCVSDNVKSCSFTLE